MVKIQQASARANGLKTVLPLLALLCTVLLWAVAANFAHSLFASGVNPLELAGISAMIATFGCAILHSFLARSQAKAITRQQFVLGLMFVLLVGTNYIAIQLLPVAVAVVLLFTSPILVVLWSALTSHRIPSLAVIVALVLSIVGVILVSNVLTINVSQVNWISILVGLSTAVYFAIYAVLSEQISKTEAPVEAMLKVFSIASLFWLAYQLTQGIPSKLLTPETFPKVLFVGFAGTLLPYLLFFWSIQRVQAERAAIIATLEPFVAGVLAWIWFGEMLSGLQLLGGIFIIVATTSLQLQPSSTTGTNPET